MCLGIVDDRGGGEGTWKNFLNKLDPNDRETPSGHWNRQVRLQLKAPIPSSSTALQAGSSFSHSSLAGSSMNGGACDEPSTALATAVDDMRQMPFVELCRLLEQLEAVPQGPQNRGFNERRLQLLEKFWRNGTPPRHSRKNLFDVMRLLLAHNDARRYYWGVRGIVEAVGKALFGGDNKKAKRLSETWLDGGEWANGVRREAALVLQYEWRARVGKLDPSVSRITVGQVNFALNFIDRSHKDHAATARRRGSHVSYRAAQAIWRSNGLCAYCCAT